MVIVLSAGAARESKSKNSTTKSGETSEILRAIQHQRYFAELLSDRRRESLALSLNNSQLARFLCHVFSHESKVQVLINLIEK